MEGERAELYRARMEEAAAATKLGKDGTHIASAVADGREAISKLRAAGSIDEAVLRVLDAALAAAAPAKNVMLVDESGKGPQVQPTGPTEQTHLAAPYDMAAVAAFLAAAADGGAAQMQSLEDRVKHLRQSRDTRSAPY